MIISTGKVSVSEKSLLDVLSLPLTENLLCIIIYKKEQNNLVSDFLKKISKYIIKTKE